MKRAAGRAYRRIRGTHPRRPKSRASTIADIGCDLLLTGAAAGLLGGSVLVIWALATGLSTTQLVAGAALLALGVAALLLWERIAWEPFVEDLSEHVSDLT